jgi:hypothetical protein
MSPRVAPSQTGQEPPFTCFGGRTLRRQFHARNRSFDFKNSAPPGQQEHGQFEFIKVLLGGLSIVRLM